MIYVLISPENIVEFNRSIQRLSRPSHLRDAHYITDFYAPILTHADGRTCLVLLEMETIPIHIESDGAELLQMLSVFVQDGSITQQEADGIVAALGQNIGQQVRLADFIPPSWQGNVMTQDEAEADGWFPSEEII